MRSCHWCSSVISQIGLLKISWIPLPLVFVHTTCVSCYAFFIFFYLNHTNPAHSYKLYPYLSSFIFSYNPSWLFSSHSSNLALSWKFLKYTGKLSSCSSVLLPVFAYVHGVHLQWNTTLWAGSALVIKLFVHYRNRWWWWWWWNDDDDNDDSNDDGGVVVMVVVVSVMTMMVLLLIVTMMMIIEPASSRSWVVLDQYI